MARYRGDFHESVRCFEECVRIAIEEGDWHRNVGARLNLAWVLLASDSPDQALAQAEAAYRLSVDAGNTTMQGEAMIVVGAAHLDLGAPSRAVHPIADGLRILPDRGRNVDLMSMGVRVTGRIAFAHGNYDLAVRFLMSARAEDQRIHYVEAPADVSRSECELTEAQGLIDVATWVELIEAALHAPFDDVLDEAVDYLEGIAISHQPSAPKARRRPSR